MSITSHQLKTVNAVHLVDKFPSSVIEVCKVFDAFDIQRKNTDCLLAFSDTSTFRIENTTIRLCLGNIQSSIAQGIAIFVDKHLHSGDSKLFKDLQIMNENAKFQEYLQSSRTDDKVHIFPGSSSMMYDVVIAPCPDVDDKYQIEKDMCQTVKMVLQTAVKRGFGSFAISVPEILKGKSVNMHTHSENKCCYTLIKV